MNIQTDRQCVPAGTSVVRHMWIQVTAPGKAVQTERPGVAVSLVLDRSGSMAGSKLALAHRAVAHALQLLDERDHLGVVCFDNVVDTVVTGTRVTPAVRASAADRLRQVDARGGTDLHGGWMAGAAQIVDEPQALGVKKVLLLTDGQANHGETDPEALAAYAATLRGAGVSTTAFGVGRDFDEGLLSRIAREGGGNFYYIERPEQIADYFSSELGEALEVVARDVELIIDAAVGVQISVLNDFPLARVPGGGVRIRLGDLVAEQEVSLLVAVECGAEPEGSRVRLRVRLSDRDQVLFGGAMPVDWLVVDAERDRDQPVNVDVLVQAATLIADRARTTALAANRRREFDRARAVIEQAVQAVRALGVAPEIQAVARELVLEVAQMDRDLDPLLAKAMHFRSHTSLRGRDKDGRARKRPLTS